MKENDFEANLQRHPLRSTPPEWRQEILRNALAVCPEPRAIPTWLNWIEALTRPRPLAWGGMAVAWVVVAMLQLAANGSGATRSQPTLATSQTINLVRALERIREDKAMLALLFDGPPAMPVVSPPRREETPGPQGCASFATATA